MLSFTCKHFPMKYYPKLGGTCNPFFMDWKWCWSPSSTRRCLWQTSLQHLVSLNEDPVANWAGKEGAGLSCAPALTGISGSSEEISSSEIDDGRDLTKVIFVLGSKTHTGIEKAQVVMPVRESRVGTPAVMSAQGTAFTHGARRRLAWCCSGRECCAEWG